MGLDSGWPVLFREVEVALKGRIGQYQSAITTDQNVRSGIAGRGSSALPGQVTLPKTWRLSYRLPSYRYPCAGRIPVIAKKCGALSWLAEANSGTHVRVEVRKTVRKSGGGGYAPWHWT